MKQWLKTIFYAPKHSKPTDENMMRLLLPSFVGIVICMVCLAGSTWAWFSASVQTAPQTIVAASFDISAALTDEAGEPVSPDQPLQAGQAYTVTLTASGTAPSGGYCKVEGGGKTLYTAPILPGDEPFFFTFIPENDDVYTFTGVWGSYAGTADITDGITIGRKSEVQPEPEVPETQQPADNDEAIHVVQSGDSLWEIAKQYDMTVEKLAAYNEINDPDSLQVGQIIKVPSKEDDPLPNSAAPSGSAEPLVSEPAEEEPTASTALEPEISESSESSTVEQGIPFLGK